MKIRQVSVFIENEPGRLYEITRMLGDNNLNIRALSLADTTDFGIIRFIVTEPEKAYKVLKEHGFTVGSNEVVAITIPDSPGSLSNILELFKNKNINVEYMYAFVKGSDNDAVMIFRFNNIDHALSELHGAGIAVLSEDELFSI